MRTFFPTMSAALLVLLAASAIVAGPANKAPDNIVIDDCVAKRSAVAFPHATHAKTIACGDCHHTQAKLTATSTENVPACGTCHTAPEKPETPKCAEMSLTKNPYHISCIGCHKQEKAKNAALKVPTKCDECHPKS